MFVTLDDVERVSNGRRVWANSEESLNLREGPCQLCACLWVRIGSRRRRRNRRPKLEDDVTLTNAEQAALSWPDQAEPALTIFSVVL